MTISYLCGKNSLELWVKILPQLQVRDWSRLWIKTIIPVGEVEAMPTSKDFTTSVCERLIIPLSQDLVIPVSKGFHHTLWVMPEPHLRVKHSSCLRVKILSHRQLRFYHIMRVHTSADTSVQVWGGNGSPNTGWTSGFLSRQTPTSNNSDVKWKDSQNCPLLFPTFLFSQTHLHTSWPPTNPLPTHKHTCTASFTVTRGGNHSAAFWPRPHPHPGADSSCLPRCASSWVRGHRSPQSWGRWCRRNPRWPSTDRSPLPGPPGEKQQQIMGAPHLCAWQHWKKRRSNLMWIVKS